MGKTITYFMWGYQPNFCIGRKCVAERLFQYLDSEFDPEVFLVGILADTDEEHFPACVEPEDDFWIHSSAFDQVPTLAESLLREYTESRLMHSHPIAHQRHIELLLRRSLRDAIARVIDAAPLRPANMTYFVSLPCMVGHYWVAVVLGLQEKVLNQHYSLKQSAVAMHECRNISVSKSLIDATIAVFFDDSLTELAQPDAGSDLSRLDTEEALRSAGRRLMTDVVWRIDQGCIEGLHNLFRACTVISSLYYEKSAGAGTIIIARKDHPAVSRIVELGEPAKLGDYRAARKLLQLASHGVALHTDSEKVFGLATVKDYDDQGEDLLEVRMLGHHHWELLHAGNLLMRVRYGQPYLPKLSFNEAKLRSDLPRLFRDITRDAVDTIVSLSRQAEEESHGTMLLITEAAEEEAQRLGMQGTPVKPCALTPEILKHLTPIDGAVILGPDGTCYAIGTILDGMATEYGDPGRGARFNSAVRYVQSSDAPCLAIIFSEDGGVDFVPNLMPAIKRSEIENVVAQLRTLKDAPRVTRRRYAELFEWCDKHRFYLNQSHCDELNQLVQFIEARLDAEDPRTVKVIHPEFVADPAMDESLYYSAE